MRRRGRAFIIGIGIMMAAAALSGCGKKAEEAAVTTEAPTVMPEETKTIVLETEPTTEAETEPEGPEERKEVDGKIQSYLTGEMVDVAKANRRPVAVMMSNDKASLPQYGINRADVVYEAPVEGDMNRYMAIFEDYDDIERIGSVRSCRTYYLLFAKEFEANYVHFGYSEYAADYLAQPSFYALDGMAYCSFYRTADRVAPHNAYTSWNGIMDSVAKKGYDTVYPQNFVKPFSFNEEDDKQIQIAGGETCNTFYPGYPYNKPWFEYDESTGEYLRFQFDDAQIDAETGEQLSYKNILVKYVEPDYYENGTPNYKVDGTGAGLFITNGKAVQVTWKKDSETSGPTKYYYEDGTEIVLNQGKTYICQVETTQNITVE